MISKIVPSDISLPLNFRACLTHDAHEFPGVPPKSETAGAQIVN
jgi:hypothetical protein